MATCNSCGAELSIAVRFCSSCGTPVGSDDMATLEFATAASPHTARPVPASSPSQRPPSSSGFAISEGRFLPGRLLAGRYRIIALLGRGGMGEVYRADDLTLGQPVALKFLPEEATRDESLLERFRNEVRIARRVSHPNVCRVYDVGDVDGHTFFTMEYVDGEDLASLLRRIGRLPEDKATDIARQLCAGLAAAHAKGVLHRDLKPANIMLDGRGQVVMTDFGLAGLADQIHGADVRSGTPAYMAPEQLAGKEVTAQSDIYALGLVLYEVFTGKRAFTAETLAELVRSGTQSTPSRPSSVVKDLDPVVERVILRCLEPEPRNRPATALSVAAAMPGGDPLAAALAAGETPSPQMVAAAGENVGLKPRTALICLLALVVGLGLSVYLALRGSALEQVGLDQPPEVLRQKARELIARLGYEGRPADSSFDFDYDTDFVNYVEKNDKPHPNWDQVMTSQPPVLHFLYRQSPELMVASDFHDMLLTPGVIGMTDPATTVSGMINLKLDAHGRLLYFQAIPPEKDSDVAPAKAIDWNLLLNAAGLNPAELQSAPPQWNSLASSDARAAWTGKWPGSGRPLRVEAAAYHGRPVFFGLVGEWTDPPRMKAEDAGPGKGKGGAIIGTILAMCMIGAGTFLARVNYRRGRSDRTAAFRLAYAMFIVEMVLWLCRSHLVPGVQTFGLFVIAVSTALFVSGMTWILYLAVEPYVRRFWPHSIISWSRLVAGRLRDPLVGRDILFGVMLGTAWLLIFKVTHLVLLQQGSPPSLAQTDYLIGGREALAAWWTQLPVSVLATLEFFFVLLGLKVVLRMDWLAAIVFVGIFTLAKAYGSSHLWVLVPSEILIYTIAVIIVMRFGLVPLACAVFTVNLLGNVPFTSDFSAWYATTPVAILISVVALAGWGFYNALGDQPLWKLDPDER
ncbi:MAG: protein kinase [Acidobacteria bacterium]|nr:protein kinase [Acidobacteriota bacterium]